MCGRFTLMTERDVLRERFSIMNMDDLLLQPSYNIAPSQPVLAVIRDGEQNRAGYLQWGLIPSWAKDPKMGYKLINARAETIAEKPSFKRAFQSRRCLIIADSFYEWKKDGDRKIPMRIMLASHEPFAFAGLWEKWMEPATGETRHTCTIITTAANELMRPIHDRMPAILTKESEAIWLDRSIVDTEALQHCLAPYASDEMSSYEISTLVNSPKNNVPECIAPIDKTS